MFFKYRSCACDDTLENCFFQISSYSHAYASLIYEKTKGQVAPILCWENKTYKLKKSIKLPTENAENAIGKTAFQLSA